LRIGTSGQGEEQAAMSTRRNWRLIAGVCLLSMASMAAARAEDEQRQIWVNGLRMSADEILILEDHFGVRLRDGAYRYDPETGDFSAAAMSRLKSDEKTGDPQYAEFKDNADPVEE
jgi:hypothetical protein